MDISLLLWKPPGKTVSLLNCLLQSISLSFLCKTDKYPSPLQSTLFTHSLSTRLLYILPTFLFISHVSFQPSTSPNIPFFFASLSQSPSIWVSKSGRAPAPPKQLGCKGAECAGPSRDGAGSTRGGTGLRLPGAPGRPIPPLLHTRRCRLPRSVRGWSRPLAYRCQRSSF